MIHRILILCFLCSWFVESCFAQVAILTNLQSKPQIFKPVQAYKTEKNIKYSPDPLVSFRWSNPQAQDELEVYQLTPVFIQTDTENSAKWDKSLKNIKVTRPCNIMVDFGRVSPGWLEFDSEDFSGEVEMSISEYNRPAVTNWMVKHSKKTTSPVKSGNTYRLELNDQLYEGVRFGWIHLKNISRPFTISEVRLVCQAKPANYEGSFWCNNESLNRVWYTGAYTVRANFLKDYFGAILMDRGDRYSWTGDAHISQYVSLLTFGNYEYVKQNIIRTAKDANGIASYSLYWVLSLIDYFYYTNDSLFFNAMINNAIEKLDSANLKWDKPVNLGFYGWDERLGAGFESPDCDENQQAYKMLCIGTWLKFSKALAVVDRSLEANKYEQLALSRISTLRRSQSWIDRLGIHSSADAINGSFMNRSETEYCWDKYYTDRLNRISYSPFNLYFILEAMAKMGRHSEALSTIDDSWGGQLRHGATTTYEVFHPAWLNCLPKFSSPVNMLGGFVSLAHPWSSGASRWLTEEILGIKPLSPGFKTFAFKTNLNQNVSSVRGDVPTMHGTISASYDIMKGKGEIVIPKGCAATISLPLNGKRIKSVEVNGEKISPDKSDANFTTFLIKEAGKFIFRVKYAGDFAKIRNESLTYPLDNSILVDSISGGNWKNKFGSKGYLILNYDGTSIHRQQLPDYIEKTEIRCSDNFRNWGTAYSELTTTDFRMLISDVENEKKICSGYFNAINTTIELNCKKSADYKLSIYFVDWKRENLSSIIEVFDLETKNILMPNYLIQNYGEGKYVTLTLDRSVRIRIQRLYGENTAICGLFFD